MEPKTRVSADDAQAAQFATEVDAEIGVAQIVLATLAVRPQTARTRHQISVMRHELAALRLLRYRLQDCFGV